jgi:hypothetical protein
MSTVNRTIENDQQKTMAIRLLEARPVPFTLSLTDGKHRSTAQNRLQHLWMAEIAQQKGDMTPAEVRAYCKLTIGVPLLRAENEAFRAKYDEVVKPLSYQQKIAIMGEPLDMPVTRLMTTKQQTQYLDAIAKHFGEQGIILTMPEDLRRELETNSNPGKDTPSSDAGNDEAGYATPASSTEPSNQPSSSADAGSNEEPPGGPSPNTTLAAGSSSQSQLPDQGSPDLGKEPAPPSLPPQGAGSGSLFPKDFNFAEGDLVHLKDFARKALDIAADATMSTGGKAYDIEGMETQYREVLTSDDALGVLMAMMQAINVVTDGKRTREKAAGYIATELLGCKASELEGRK